MAHDLTDDGNVLITSEDPETGEFWAHALRQRGLEVAVAGSAEEALSQWATETFDLAVVDIHTPPGDGIGVCRRLRAEGVDPILLLVPGNDETHVLAAYKAGVDECIVEPIGPALFQAKVAAWLRRSRAIPAGAASLPQLVQLLVLANLCWIADWLPALA